jgi:phosphoribosylaminoimidazole (AIR) synthetase
VGIGLVAVVRAADEGRVIEHLASRGLPARAIGDIVPGSGKVVTAGSLPW